MSVEIWGATFTPYLTWPQRPLGYFLLLVYVAFFLYGAGRYGAGWRKITSREWVLTLSLSLAAIISSQLLLLKLPASNLLPPIAVATTPVNLLPLLGLVPLLLAALRLNPVLVIVVGMASGLGRAGWHSHQVLEIFHYGLVAGGLVLLLRNPYAGRFYAFLRWPLTTAVVVPTLILPITVGLASYSYAPASASSLAALDLARSLFTARIGLAIAEGLVGGLLIVAGQYWRPAWRFHPAQLTPSPLGRTLSRRLTTQFLLYSTLLLVALATTVFAVSLRVSTDLVLDQIGHEAHTISRRIAPFRDARQNVLVQYSQDARLLGEGAGQQEAALRQLFRTVPFYRRVMLVEQQPTGEPVFRAVHPAAGDTAVGLTSFEQAALQQAWQSGYTPSISLATAVDGGRSVVTFIVPFVSSDGRARALLGRVDEISLTEMLDSLNTPSARTTSGFIVDELGRIVAHPKRESLLTPWQSAVDESRIIRQEPQSGSFAYEGLDGLTNTRRLVYTVSGGNHPWTVVITTPYEVVLSLALQTSGPLIGVLLLATSVFLLVLAWMGRTIAQPLTTLVEASRMIAAGNYSTAVEVSNDDEVGQLGEAFTQMQKALRRRMEELSLLLSVSQKVSSSLNIAEGMPAVLQAALRGTGASGARVVVLNPTGRYPLTFGEGPSDKVMSLYDRRIMQLIREEMELILPTQDEVLLSLDPDGSGGMRMPFKALIAFALHSHNRFQGVFWLTYRQERNFLQTEVDLLRTLSSQAAVLTENARLFATAEGGRRRLAAVLTSTTDAVIVTDQTDRILLLNPAAESILKLRVQESQNRLIGDVIANEELATALVADNLEKVTNLEIKLDDGRIYFANASTIINTDGQEIGRVAVLHDVTHMKELDEMKSNFVQMVSHDLRSPLTYMNGFTSMLPMVGDLNEKQQDYLDKIQRGIEQMNALVKNLLDLGRLEAGLELMRSPARLDNMIVSIAEDVQPMADQTGIHLVVERPVKLPYLNLDSALVRQAVMNLVTNALKYAPDSGQVTIRASIEPDPHGRDEVVISVSDNGPGISAPDQIRLFEKFQRVQHRDNFKVKGSGLGLAIVKSVAERHGGRAWVTSAVGEGSTFYISVPLEPVDFASF